MSMKRSFKRSILRNLSDIKVNKFNTAARDSSSDTIGETIDYLADFLSQGYYLSDLGTFTEADLDRRIDQIIRNALC